MWRAFVRLRAWQTGGTLLAYYNDPAKRALMKPEAIFEVESGLKLSAFDITAASTVRSEWYHAVRRFFERYDYFIVPTAQVFRVRHRHALAAADRGPEDADLSRVDEGRAARSPWRAARRSRFPAGFSAHGLPIGIQIVGPNHADLACLQLAYAYDTATDWVSRRPPPLLALG